jgi:glycyl-tRNA synthetase beta chain
MKDNKNLLIEIGTEELPPKTLKQLVDSFAENIKQKLTTAEFTFAEIKSFTTPRRLALLIEQINSQQPNRAIEKRGPALKAAYDENNKPTKALEGFLRSCNAELNKLEKLETAQGSWLVYRYREHGKTIQELLPAFVNQALSELPIAKPMRWDSDVQFVRPVHWVVMLYGKELIDGVVLGIKSDRKTYGHRFHHPAAIKLSHADDYQKVLKDKGCVIVDFAERKENIRQQIEELAKKQNSCAIIPEVLLDEVTSLVEWPVALLVNFNKEFLSVPREALISAMQEHQRCFALEDNNKKLLSYFITISNIKSKNPQEVIRGNERVMRARLSDAKFFYETDCKQTLESYLESLKNVVFQAKLGSMYDKSVRVAALAKQIAQAINANASAAERAGLLCKTDLLTNMVGEFPELQGIMGYYYAKHDGENEQVATAIREHYQPRFAGDKLPETLEGCVVALADRIDTLVGIFAINQIPTGDKDPFGLRRAALGIIRILIEKEIELDVKQFVSEAVLEFIFGRLPTWYEERNISSDTVASVLVRTRKLSCNLFDLHLRILAVQEFRQLPEANSLIEANKRSKNLWIKSEVTEEEKIKPELFKCLEEKKLYQAMQEINKIAANHEKNKQYQKALVALASLQKPVAEFFDKVLVMDEDKDLRNNRLALLTELRQLFLLVADISLLQL